MIKDICESEILSAQIATAPVVLPVIFSPIIISEVFPVDPVIEERTKVGADGSEVSTDSYTAWIAITSGVFKEILSSWTLVPYG